MQTNDDFKKTLTREQYAVLREHATERPGSSPLNYEKRDGTYACAACANPLFTADTKYESGSGWPSFYAPIEGGVTTKEDRSMFVSRTEVLCARCGSHLGHVFDDGPRPTGERYCMNGVALDFAAEPEA